LFDALSALKLFARDPLRINGRDDIFVAAVLTTS